MKCKSLTMEEHKELAKHIYAIQAHHSAMLKVLNGKVTMKILDRFSTFGKLDNPLQKLRSDLEEVMYKDLGDLGRRGLSVYYGGIDAACKTTLTVRDQRDQDDQSIWSQA